MPPVVSVGVADSSKINFSEDILIVANKIKKHYEVQVNDSLLIKKFGNPKEW